MGVAWISNGRIMEVRAGIELEVVSGTVIRASVEHISLNILDGRGDREGIAATGVLLAAMGLSGPVAGMTTFSSETYDETVAKVALEMDGLNATAILAAWPFAEGEKIKLVGTTAIDGQFVALAALDEARRIVVLYPHVTAGSCAHRLRVIRYSLWVGIPTATITVLLLSIGNYALGQSFQGFFSFLAVLFALCLVMVILVGCRMGVRFVKFVRVAERVFSAFGWEDVKWIDLHKYSVVRRKSCDTSGLGDTYFKY